MKLFGTRSQNDNMDRATNKDLADVELEKESSALVESVNEELKDEITSEQVFTCSDCNVSVPLGEIKRNLYVCPSCGKHAKISARRRMAGLADPGTFRKIRYDIPFKNPIDYPDYEEKITGLKEKTGLDEGVLSGVCEIKGYKAVVAVMAPEFLMGSMGVAVGEMITKSFETAEKLELPIIIFTASGGARMQEGILSLMQMAKTSAAVQRFSDNGGLYISVLTHPTTGGVSASFATLADITIAEPGALIGFAGPRVIEQTIGQKLPKGFQRAEYLEEHGFVDGIVGRLEMRDTLSQLLKLHEKRRKSWLR